MKVIKFIFLIGILSFSIYYINNNLNINNITEIININEKQNNTINDMINILNNKDINNVSSLLSFKTSTSIKKENKEQKVYLPKVYLYNTHQVEEYEETFYNIKPTVLTVSNMIKEELKNNNIYSLVEEKSIKNELVKRKLDYSYSYRISREYLEETRKKYPTITYFFDIHRDSINKKLSSVKIDDKSYAKVMFIVTKKNNNYKENEKNVKIMEEYLNNNYNGILRNTYYQPLYVYNQDINSTTFLIEVGGPYNTLEEIYNTSVALSNAITYLIKEKQ